MKRAIELYEPTLPKTPCLPANLIATEKDSASTTEISMQSLEVQY